MSEPKDVLPSHLNRHPHYSSLRYRDGIQPFPVTEFDPSFVACVKNFGQYEYGLIAITSLVPGYIGYSGMRKIRSVPVFVGLGFGFLSGVCYAYAYAYCKVRTLFSYLHDNIVARLSGFMPLHPK